jgi:hypothetical protein
MSQNRPGVFSSLRMGGMWFLRRCLTLNTPVADPCPEVIREKVQDGLTGEVKEMQYTQCKIVGNGSFGVVFQTKLSPNGEDAAIKRVLQDKRFKVCVLLLAPCCVSCLQITESRTPNYAHCQTPKHRGAESLLLLQWRASTFP